MCIETNINIAAKIYVNVKAEVVISLFFDVKRTSSNSQKVKIKQSKSHQQLMAFKIYIPSNAGNLSILCHKGIYLFHICISKMIIMFKVVQLYRRVTC